jgi:hypothetical protein
MSHTDHADITWDFLPRRGSKGHVVIVTPRYKRFRWVARRFRWVKWLHNTETWPVVVAEENSDGGVTLAVTAEPELTP